MSVIYLFCGLFALIFALVYYSSLKPSLGMSASPKSSKLTLVLLLACALAVRIIVACSTEGHSTDINCFKSWAQMAYGGGLSSFYGSEAFTDYPPGYMYVLWVIGMLQSVFGLDYMSTAYTLIVKLPAIICDIAAVWLVYSLVEKKVNSTAALCCSLLYALNPAVIINSAAWAQVDSIFTLFVVLLIYFAVNKNLLASCLLFSAGALVKPQTIIFAPILLIYIYELIFVSNNKKAAAKKLAISIGASIALVFVLVLPFTKGFDFMPIINQYISTLGSYNYASVNAFNVFALFGGIWRDASVPFLFIPYSVWTYIFVAAILGACVYVYKKQKGEVNLFLLAAFIITAMFTFAAKMHERYVFPAMLLLICAFAYKKDLRIMVTYAILSIGQFLNTGVMLIQNLEQKTTAPPDGALVPVICIINIFAFAMLCRTLLTPNSSSVQASGRAKTKKAKAQNVARARKPFELMRSAEKMRITRIDALIMAAVTLIYGAVAIFNLGDMRAPATAWDSMQIGDGFVFRFDDSTPPERINWFTGVFEEREMALTLTAADGTESTDTLKLDSVFCWHSYDIAVPSSVISLTATGYDTMINEMVFTDAEGNVIAPLSAEAIQTDCGIQNLTDEADMLPREFSYKNGTYFDEIYHARTAYEYIHGMSAYENTHPPLGKLIISLGILIFGMNPFGWRITGTLFGIFMLPLIYIFAKKLFKNTKAASAAMIFLAADFMHFSQTRIATIDVYITFFIILMYYFMYTYTTMSFYDTPFKKTLLPLALSGICMGLGIASKWTGIYAGLGLAVIFFVSLGRRIYEYKRVSADKNASAEQKKAVEPCRKYCIYTILWCVIFFAAVPCAIYCASYIPYLRAPEMNGFESIIENQVSMLSYHSSLTDTHPFSSPWYEWPFIIRPIWYYSGQTGEGLSMTIASFGNPFVWWAAVGAMIYLVYRLIKDKCYNALFLIIGFLAQYLPWVGVSRVVFIYHYFTSVPFLVLMLAYCAKDILEYAPSASLSPDKTKTRTILVFGYCALCVWAFCAFYPALSGMAVDASYIDSLKWYESWIF